MILSGTPLNETVVYGSPFEINTQEEVNQPKLDYQKGQFGTIEY
jgi:redox-sensitive bicupin YhaK (pirin superfamily)